MTQPGTPPTDLPIQVTMADIVNEWKWERSPRHSCAVPEMPAAQQAAWIQLGEASLQRPLTADEQALFDALDRKAGFRKAHEIARPRVRGKKAAR